MSMHCQISVSQAVKRTLVEYMENSLAGTPMDINNGLCDDFAGDVVRSLTPHCNVSDVEFANLTGGIGAEEATESFCPDFLTKHGYILPAGVTIDKLNACGLGDFGSHVFVMLTLAEKDYLFFDSECVEGVSSPFELPFALRRLMKS